MTFQTWWLFAGAVFLLCGTPGPNMLHILSRSVALGPRRSIAAMAGCLSALVAVLAASAAGLTTVLVAVPALFEILRYAGMAYLVLLGVRSWRAGSAPVDVGDGALPPALSTAALFRGGFAIGISNPKLILFAAAFLPQFVTPARPQAPQFAILVATFAVVECFWYALYALGGRSLATRLDRPETKRTFNRVTGAIFIAFAAALLSAKRS